jgi:tetratricopeptide (TPR) repeat protein
VAGWVDDIKINLGSVSIRPESVEFEAVVSSTDKDVVQGPKSFSIDLTTIGTVESRRCPGFVNRGLCKTGYGLTEEGKWKYAWLWWSDAGDAQAFADAINSLRASARGEDREFLAADWRQFQQEAATWRALEVKPAISEEVRKRRLLAESAVAEKQFGEAVEEYEAGLEINPTWPEGHFNAALLCAELGYRSEAIHHMRAYLELVPEAPDAQAARDQMIIWEAELKKTR